MTKKNAFYAQSGGVTATINITACAVIETARKHKNKIGKVYAGRDGIIGALTEDLIDTSKDSAAAIRALRHTPGGAFGSCRYKLKGLEESRAQYERLIEVFKAHDIGYFFYNGGNDSADTSHKISQVAQTLGYPLVCIGIPKTVDNDLAITDCCPGFGSVAKYVATSIREAGYDVASMARTSTRVFILEVMGRHAGWITAACGLAQEREGEAPHILLFPEIPFDQERFLARVTEMVGKFGYCAIGVSEGLRRPDGKFLSESGLRDAFGHAQLGGVAPLIAQLVQEKLKLEVPLGGGRLPAAFRPPYRVEDGRPAVLRGGQGRRRACGERPQRRDADHRQEIDQALPLGDRSGGVEGHRQRGEDDAARLHHRGRLSHHGEMPAIPRAAGAGRGLPALPQRAAGIRDAQECGRAEETQYGIQDLKSVKRDE